MKNPISLLILVFFSLACWSCSANTAEKKPVIPLSIDHVETHRTGENLVRIIRHNMEILPQIDLELLSTPTLTLLDHLAINHIQLDGKERSFAQSAGVFVEDITLKGNKIRLTLDYYFSDEDSSIVVCEVTIHNTFQKLICSRD